MEKKKQCIVCCFAALLLCCLFYFTTKWLSNTKSQKSQKITKKNHKNHKNHKKTLTKQMVLGSRGNPKNRAKKKLHESRLIIHIEKMTPSLFIIHFSLLGSSDSQSKPSKVSRQCLSYPTLGSLHPLK